MSNQTTADEGSLNNEVDVVVELNLGREFSEDGPRRDIPKAIYHYRIAADAGSSEAAYEVACLSSKEKVECWKPLAEYYYRKAIAGGITDALRKLGDLYYLGDWDSERLADPHFNSGLYKRAALLYFMYVKEMGDDAKREMQFLGRMLSSNWLRADWSFYGPLVECLAENDNDDALHIYLDGNIPEPTETYEIEDLLAESFDLPDLVVSIKHTPPTRTWGRSRGKRSVTSILYDMGIEFTRSRNGIIKTKKGLEIKEDMEKMASMGYKFKYSSVSDKWTCKDTPKE